MAPQYHFLARPEPPDQPAVGKNPLQPDRGRQIARHYVPGNALPQNITASVTASAGYFWFGNQSAALGGFPLSAYLNWNAGVTFTRKSFNLDLRYYDTNLSKENCYVFTGDPNATPGGSIDTVRNPEGLTSRWCSATFVAKLWFALN